jgi:hypothetical protein
MAMIIEDFDQRSSRKPAPPFLSSPEPGRMKESWLCLVKNNFLEYPPCRAIED